MVVDSLVVNLLCSDDVVGDSARKLLLEAGIKASDVAGVSERTDSPDVLVLDDASLVPRRSGSSCAIVGLYRDGDDLSGYVQAGVHDILRLDASPNIVRTRIGLAFKRSLLESKLHHSSEFLSNLIDSTVDAIVATDRDNKVILFNKGAEKLFGYAASEVIGQVSIGLLFPDGVAHQIGEMLRSGEHGGVGRLEQIRKQVRSAGNELVPVNMTVSTIYEGEREVAKVGIFSDLRDRIRIEQSLLQTQEKLKEQQQQSLLAELAGATAHELNQPLTSIIGYAQLIQRTSELQSHHQRYTDTIVQEAERMAEIVKKIGRITHYETVSYVGSANIVDINASVEASESAAVPMYLEEQATARILIEDTDGIDDGSVTSSITSVRQSESDGD